MHTLWLASGEQNAAFEREFADYIGVKHALCVNSGSAANLIALAALDLPKGSKVITSGCGFPATLSPILHLGLEPILVDYDLATHNIDVEQVIREMPNAKAVLFAHTMGVPVAMRRIMETAEHYGVDVIEDCCEALGATFHGEQVGSIGDMGTFSFYPSHQITALGGGGMITFKEEKLYRRAKSLRDWGKMSNWDAYGQTDTAYDVVVDGQAYFKHYAYETVGYNAKLPEANAAFGRVQMERLDGFVKSRSQNHAALERCVRIDRVKHEVPDGALPSWFGFVITLKNGDRNALGNYLEALGIKHRPFFAGNITRHKPFEQFKRSFPVADKLMRDSLFIGCHPGLTVSDLDYVIEKLNAWGTSA
jgi:CDP-6-deoxy-D-xylo-4-hexulose-3-dehydrase